MSLSLPFSPGNSVDISSAMENTYQSFEPQGQWQFNTADPGADPSSIYPRKQPMLMLGGFGAYICHI
jgi:hypothetical protein